MMNIYEAEKMKLEAEKEALEIRGDQVCEELDKLSERSGYTTILFAIFPPGLHRIMSGKILSGLIYMFTGGGFLIWTIIDLITIGVGKFKDKDGKCINEPKRRGLEIELTSIMSKIEEIDKKLKKYQ